MQLERLAEQQVASPMFGGFGIESDHITVGGFIDELRSAP